MQAGRRALSFVRSSPQSSVPTCSCVPRSLFRCSKPFSLTSSSSRQEILYDSPPDAAAVPTAQEADTRTTFRDILLEQIDTPPAMSESLSPEQGEAIGYFRSCGQRR